MIKILSVAALSVAMMLDCATAIAQQSKMLASVYDLNIVESPSEFDRWWREIINTPEGKAALDAVAAYFGCEGCGTAFVEGVNAVRQQRDEGNEHKGWIQAPVGYTICRAWVVDPSVNCNGTFTGSYRRADDPASGGIDGLHYYMVVPTPRIGAGRCWVDGDVNVTFALAQSENEYLSKCGQSGEIAFHYGK